ncbi:MAG: hypothetical protein ACOYJB_02345 [Christensenellaceae bacterium]
MRTRFKILITALVIAAAVLLFVYFFFFADITFKRSGMVELDSMIPENAVATEQGVLYNENDVLHLMDYEGVETWALPLDMQQAELAVSEEQIAVYTDKSVQVMTFAKEQLFSTSFDNVLKVTCGKNNTAVLSSSVNEAEETLYYIYLLNEAGEQVKPVEAYTRQVIDFGFHGENDMFWLLTLDTTSVVPVSNISTYKADGTPTSNMGINTQIVEEVYFTDSLIFPSGTHNLMSYTYFGEKQTEALVYGWQPAAKSISGDTIRLAYIPADSRASIQSAHVYSTDLTSVALNLPRNVRAVAITQNKFYAIASSEIYVYNTDGTFDKSEQLDIEVARAKQLSEKCVLLWDNQKTYLMQPS